MEQLNVKKILMLFYIIIPTIFYAVPLILILINQVLSIRFYKTYYPTVEETMVIFFGHLILGSTIYFFTKKNINYKKTNLSNRVFYNFLAVLIFVIFIFSKHLSGVISMLSMAIFIVLIANVKLYKFIYVALFILSLVELIVYKERYLTVFIMLLMILSFLSKRTIWQLILFSFVGIFVLVFILQPLRYGQVPFSNLVNINMVFYDIYKHLNPIYYTAYLSNSIDFSLQSLFVEFIPFGKSLSASLGVVERLAQEVLPQFLIEEGARLGSNSAMYFSFKGIFFLFIMFVMIYGSQKIIKSSILTNSITLYLILQGPYFIRRSFASYTIDIIIVICVVLIVLIVKQRIIILRKKYEN